MWLSKVTSSELVQQEMTKKSQNLEKGGEGQGTEEGDRYELRIKAWRDWVKKRNPTYSSYVD